MALRIVREEVYLPLPMGKGAVLDMAGEKEYFVPIEEINAPEYVLDELKGLGKRAAARGLVIQCSDTNDTADATEVHGESRVAYSVLCGLSTRNGVQHLHLRHVEPVNFGLYWEGGKFYQHETKKE